MKQKQIEIVYPTQGLNRKVAYRQQPPYSTPDCLNVRALETIASRERGGSRPGLTLSHVDGLGSFVNFLSPMVINPGDNFTNFSDTFGGLVMSSAWQVPSWGTSLPLIMTDIPAAAINTATPVGDAVMSPESSLPINTNDPYAVEAYLVPWNGLYAGTYRIYLRLGLTPDIATSGVMVEITMTDNTGGYVGSVTSNVDGVNQTPSATFSGSTGSSNPGWLSVTVTGDTADIYWCGVHVMSGVALGTQAGTGVGFGLECTVAGGICLVNVFRVQYYAISPISSLRSLLVASAGGNLWYEQFYGRMTVLSTLLTLGNYPLTAAQDGQQLYIADYGQVAIPNATITGLHGVLNGLVLTDTQNPDFTTLGILPNDMVVVITNALGTAIDETFQIASVASGQVNLQLTTAQSTQYGASPAWTGAVAYRIERAPKVYDPIANTLTILSADYDSTSTPPSVNGQVPTGCPLIARYLDRIVLAGAAIAPQVWYMSHVSDPQDWDYSKLATGDVQSAVAGTASPAGIPGDPITALVAHSDDYLVIGCRNSLWKMAGDPANGGALVNLSHAIGIIGENAWCLCPDGSMVFLSMDGIYILDAAGDAFPVSISRETLPREFANLDPDMLKVSMQYDIHGGGIHLFLTPNYSAKTYHWWIDTGMDTSTSYGILSQVSRRGFWPFTLISDHEPTASCTLLATAIEDSAVILGGRDGYLRKFSDLADTDIGYAFDSYVIIGPIGLGPDLQVGTLLSLDAVLGDDSNSLTWSVIPALTFEDATSGTISSTGTWTAGINATEHPSARGQAFTLTLTGNGLKWATEQVSAFVKEGGRRRIQ